MQGFRDLSAYQKAFKLAIKLHKISLHFPKFEEFELGSQVRRASKSIALNIAEGFGKRSTTAEFKRFLSIALGSCDEVRACIDFMLTLNYIDRNLYNEVEIEAQEIGKMLSGMIKNWK